MPRGYSETARGAAAGARLDRPSPQARDAIRGLGGNLGDEGPRYVPTPQPASVGGTIKGGYQGTTNLCVGGRAAPQRDGG